MISTNTLKRKPLGEPTKLRSMVSAGLKPRMAGPFDLGRYPNVVRRETAHPGSLQTDQLRSIQEAKAKAARVAELRRQAAARAEAVAKAAAARKALAKKAAKPRKAPKSGRAKKRA